MYVVVAGAGIVGKNLATRLNEAKHDVVVIDINPSVCEDLYARHGLETIQGSATSIDVLEAAGRMTDPQYETALKRAGATHMINIGGFYLDQLMIDIEEPEARRIATFGQGQGAIVIARVPEGAEVDGWTIERIAQSPAFPDDCVIVGLYREKTAEFIIPRGHRVILAGDQVFLAAVASDVRPALRVLGIKRWKGRG